MLRSFRSVFVSQPQFLSKFWCFCGWLVLVLGSLASAFEPHDVLEYRSRDYLQVLERLEEAQRDYRNVTNGFSSFIELKPSISYGNDDLRNTASDTELDYGLEIDAGIDYAVNWPDVYRVQKLNLLRAEDDAIERLRNDINDGLEFYITVLALQLNERNARAELAQVELAFNDAQARFEAGEISANDLEGVRIDLDDARLNVTDAERELISARRRIREEYGVRDTTARFVPVEFALPVVPVEETFEYRDAERALRQLESEALEESYFGILNDIGLEVRYERDQLREASVGIGINRGVPRAGVDIDYRPFDDNEDEEWEISLGATIRLDTGTGRDFRAGHQDIAAARAELEQIRVEYAREMPELLQEVASIRQELQLAIDNLAYIELRIIELRDELAAEAQAFSVADREFQRLDEEQRALNEELGQVDARRRELSDLRNNTEDEDERQRFQDEFDALTERRGDIIEALGVVSDPRNVAQRLRNDLARDVEGTQRTLDRLLERDRSFAENDVFNRFRDYVRRVEDYLEYTDGSWKIIND